MQDAEYLLNSLTGKTGLINHSFNFLNQKNIIPHELIMTRAEGKNLHYLNYSIDKVYAGATGFKYDDVVFSTIGEFVERMSASYLNYNSFVYTSYNDLKEEGLNALHPESLFLFADWQYSQEQFPFKKLSVVDKINWVKGTDYLSNKDIYVPAFLVYISKIDNEGLYIIPTTTGHAAGSSIERSILSGFLENVERHAWCNLWYNQRSMNFVTYNEKIILDYYDDDEEIQTLFSNNKIRIKVFDLGKDIDVECIVVFIDFEYNSKRYYSVGAAARLDKISAIKKACLEAYQCMEMSLTLFEMCSWPNNYEKVLDKLNDFESIFNFYNYYPDLKQRCPFFKEAMRVEASVNKIVRWDNRITTLSSSMLNAKGYKNVIYVNLTLDKLDIPFYVTKVIMPEFALMSPSFNYPFLGNKVFTNKNNLLIDLPHCFP